MGKTNNTIPLEKAHSVATHLARMSKAVQDYDSKVGKLHKVHNDDMQASIQKLAKMVGATDEEKEKYGSGEPVSADITSEGTPNIIGGFDRTVQPGATKAAGNGNQQPVPQTPPTNSVASLTSEQVQEMITKSVEASMVVLLKGLLNKGDGLDEEDDDEEKKQDKTKKPNKVTGVGDRTQIAPVQTVFPGPGPVRKVDDGTQTSTPPTGKPTPDLAKRALEGDSEAVLELMKINPSEIPTTLIEPLSKIH